MTELNMYELTYIVNSVLSDEQIKEIVSQVNGLVEENGGELVEVDEWGSRRLAYPINKRRNGYYVNACFRLAGEGVSRVERALEINENILRYLTLRMDSKMIRHREKRKSKVVEAAAATE
jgi:small subunit ribosomal protein S6